MTVQLLALPADAGPLVEDWLAAPHVARWWPPERSAPVLDALRGGRPLPPGLDAWRIDVDRRPVGYAQVSRIAADWAAAEGIGAGTLAVELLIGEADAVNRKLGREAIRALSAELFARPGTDRLVASPHPDNWGAIIAFKRAGYRERGRRQLRAGPVMLLTAAKAVWKG